MEDTNLKYTTDNKKCAKCLIFKPFLMFNKCKRASLGLHNHCRECQQEVRRNWYIRNRNGELEKSKLFSRSEAGKLAHQKRWETKKHILGPAQNIRRKTEFSKIKARIQRKKWLEIPHNKIACNLRIRLRQALKQMVKFETTEILLGCSYETFKLYLESKFKNGMNWNNYGKWHVDHIKPCTAFDLTNELQQKECFHYSNLQPLWALENIAKSNKYL